MDSLGRRRTPAALQGAVAVVGWSLRKGRTGQMPLERTRSQLPQSRGQAVANMCCAQKPDPAEQLCFTFALGSNSRYRKAANHVLALSPPFHTPSKCDEDTVL